MAPHNRLTPSEIAAIAENGFPSYTETNSLLHHIRYLENDLVEAYDRERKIKEAAGKAISFITFGCWGCDAEIARDVLTALQVALGLREPPAATLRSRTAAQKILVEKMVASSAETCRSHILEYIFTQARYGSPWAIEIICGIVEMDREAVTALLFH